jgi:hypothetical protein
MRASVTLVIEHLLRKDTVDSMTRAKEARLLLKHGQLLSDYTQAWHQAKAAQPGMAVRNSWRFRFRMSRSSQSVAKAIASSLAACI